MPRLTAIVPLLCLALSCVQAVNFCGPNRRNQCVPHHLCDLGIEEDGPVIDIENRGNYGCKSRERCCPTSRIVQENDDNTWTNPPKQNVCGIVNKNGRRSANPGFAQENELPWMMALLHRNNTFLGGGSLITLDVVLTAHHITRNYDSSDIVVRAGEWDMNTETEMSPHVDVGVRMIVRFPSFSRRTGANNLALLFLKKPFELSDHIRPICLPSRDQAFDRKRCIFSGWGKDAVQQNSFMNILKKLNLPVVSRRTCEAQLRRTKGSAFQLHSSLMCAGGEEGRDACTGDGGSPLACPLENDPNRFEQAGIVNWGSGCGETNTPGVYTDVAKFRSWIDQQINRYSIAKDEIPEDTGGARDYWDEPTTLPTRYRPPTTTSPPKAATYSPEEINPDEFFSIPTTMSYQESDIPIMRIVKS